MKLSPIAMICLLIIRSLFLYVHAKVIIKDYKINTPINLNAVLIQYSGCKKTSLYKFYMDNMEHFKEYYMRNFVPCNLLDSL